MKLSRIFKGCLFILSLIAMAVLWGRATGSARPAHTHLQTAARSSAMPQQLSADGQASLRAIIQPKNLSDLRWPDFSDRSPGKGSRVELGFPHDLYDKEMVRGIAYGGMRDSLLL